MGHAEAGAGHNLDCDIAILGGGLAGGLIALALRRERPDLRLQVIEAGPVLGGNHIWSFFAGDVDARGMALLDPLITHRWDGYDVRFPAHRRMLDTAYHAIRSDQFDAGLRKMLSEGTIRTGAAVTSATSDNVVLESGEEIAARAVIDCRGAGDLDALEGGWQKFVGLELELAAPHGLERPVIMDATVEQIDGYRFVYLLPFGPNRIFVEDTYYSDGPELDAALIEERVLGYAVAQGWRVAEVVHREKGVLPVVCNGAFGEYWRSTGAVPKAGVRAGQFHPVTGYSLPDAVRSALFIAGHADLSGEALHGRLFARAAQRWRETSYYRMLDSMMFYGADTSNRYKILERFYRLSPALISRFYAGRSRWTDKLRIISGKPPIPVGRGIRAIGKNMKRKSRDA
ncbi:lycopene beta-cyclase CrtY [Parasphingopyxis lamellibrachiae]|uniref:Lycopene beta-cyclase n=1 Tax=Parasphingopyxis lamellibrachiae TaxID=680125 RepID=A0A3D9FGP1_9SPHN|nr:lycopene beta-cyclase CrtY [Parasphingopyxis lamellibrachiae]RED16980.1 lycopene beta-cyclase [Parasphingopyxis lamellibrachiae]